MTKIKSLAIVLLVSLCLICVTACNNSDNNRGASSDLAEAGGVSIILNDSVYSNDKKSIKAVWQNNSDYKIMFGEYFSVEKQTNGEWSEFKPSAEMAFYDIGYTLKSGASGEHTYDLSKYDFTEAGSYRISAEYSYESENSDTNKTSQTVYAEFTVK